MIFMTKKGAPSQANRRQRYSMQDIELCRESRVTRNRAAEYGRACVAAKPDDPASSLDAMTQRARDRANRLESCRGWNGGRGARNRKRNVCLFSRLDMFFYGKEMFIL